MDDLNLVEKDFIEGVWRKVQYLEYKRKEREQLVANQRNLCRKRLQSAAAILSVLVPVTLLLLYKSGPDAITLMLLGSLYTGAGQLYEAFPDLRAKVLSKGEIIYDD